MAGGYEDSYEWQRHVCNKCSKSDQESSCAGDEECSTTDLSMERDLTPSRRVRLE